MNAKSSVFVTCVEAIIRYLLLNNLDDCTFNNCQKEFSSATSYEYNTIAAFFVSSYAQPVLIYTAYTPLALYISRHNILERLDIVINRLVLHENFQQNGGRR